MKNLFLTFSLFILVSGSYAQKTISVLSGTTWTFYDDFSPALRAAPSGSIIYVPGGTFDLGSNGDTINKQLTIVGVGFSLDSAAATGITRLYGDIYLDNGADFSTFEGIHANNIVSLSLSSLYSNISIRRCYFNYLNFICTNSNFGKNYQISESFICILNGGSDPSIGITHYNNLIIEKTIVSTSFSNCYGSIFNNNILTAQDNGFVYNNACEFNNNIFIDSARYYEVATNSFFKNNIFRVSGTGWTGGGSIYLNCLWGKLPSTVFINPPSAGSWCDAVYNIQYNLHLKSTSPAKNFGTDGTDIGIYGTTKPCKDGWVPFNPHISFKSIPSESLPNGTLPINVKVVAQDR